MSDETAQNLIAAINSLTAAMLTLSNSNFATKKKTVSKKVGDHELVSLKIEGNARPFGKGTGHFYFVSFDGQKEGQSASLGVPTKKNCPFFKIGQIVRCLADRKIDTNERGTFTTFWISELIAVEEPEEPEEVYAPFDDEGGDPF